MKSIFISLLLYLLCQASPSFADDLYSKEELEFVKNRMLAHKKLRALDTQSIEELANTSVLSGIPYEIIEARLNFFLKRGELPFRALEKAITAEHEAKWRTSQLLRLNFKPDSTISQINALELKNSEKETAIGVYALCMEPFKYSAIRLERFTPKVCAPMEGYDHLRHMSDSVNIRTRPSEKNNDHAKAYEILVKAGKEIIESQNLSDLEILLMATCVAQKSIKFMTPKNHLFLTCHEGMKAAFISPESALFQEKGVCSNTSGVAYNMARSLGFSGPLFFARHKIHVFLEVEVQNEWLHFHPFKDNIKSCDFIRFKNT